MMIYEKRFGQGCLMLMLQTFQRNLVSDTSCKKSLNAIFACKVVKNEWLLKFDRKRPKRIKLLIIIFKFLSFILDTDVFYFLAEEVLHGHRDYTQVVMDVNRSLKRFPPGVFPFLCIT